MLCPREDCIREEALTGTSLANEAVGAILCFYQFDAIYGQTLITA